VVPRDELQGERISIDATDAVGNELKPTAVVQFAVSLALSFP